MGFESKGKVPNLFSTNVDKKIQGCNRARERSVTVRTWGKLHRS